LGYEEAIEWLYDLQYHGVKLGLENTKALLERLGNPDSQFKSVHVAGTNGKGSVCAFVSSILQCAGYKVGRYTSPHLSDFGERVAVNGIPMRRDEQTRAINVIRKEVGALATKGIQCTFFEATTALAFSHFAQRSVDYAVVEVGMGGRLDSTNVLNPLVSVITNVSLEHTRHLGRTVRQIAVEKAGIVKKGVPVVCAARDKKTVEVVEQRCRSLGSKISWVKDIDCQLHQSDIHGSTFSVRTRTYDISRLRTRLAGRHQLDNVGAAVLAVEILNHHDVRVHEDAVARGIGQAQWPARLQVVRTNPLVILDSTHNPAGAGTLASYIKHNFGAGKVTVVLGMLEDKDARAYLKKIYGLPKLLVATEPGYHRGMALEDLVASAPEGLKMLKAKNVASGIELALERSNGPVIITGSIFTASEALEHLNAWRVREMLDILEGQHGAGAYPGRTPGGGFVQPPETEDPFRVLISTILSQRTRDENTHAASKALFSIFTSAEGLAAADPEEVERLVKPAGFYRQKTRMIMDTARALVELHGSKVPQDLEKLLALPGVGRKTANCVLSYGFGVPAIAVDTHVQRIANLLGLVCTKEPEETENKLMALVPRDRWNQVNRLLVRHGQSVCVPARPRCSECRIAHLCDHGIYSLDS
jgi:dihydrofolate synthase/folylpolyglutamate synthase